MSTLNINEILERIATPINVRPVRRMTLRELENYLEKAADILRGNADHSEFRGYVFALLFYKRINDCFEEAVSNLTQQIGNEQLARSADLHDFIVPANDAWSKVARKPKTQLGQALNDAMISIERANAPKFDGILTNKIDFNKVDELPRDKLVNLINHFSTQKLDRSHVSDDLFGNAYEYLIRNFASKAGKSSGEFYTPAEVGYLMSEMIEPNEGHSICDWASGSGGLLLQCIRYVRKHGGDPKRLFLHAQESNLATYNISRINMILHGVNAWDHKHGDSLRDPRHLSGTSTLKQFDRIIMNPPFSLEDWGHEVVESGDKFGRLSYGTPPASNGDWAWLQHIVKSLKDPDQETNIAGKGIVVMSQGVLFRGQAQQTEEVDGVNQKADAEYTIRSGFVESDLIECVVVLPSKLFYGNGVPACLVLINKEKSPERKNKTLMIWASRHYQRANPQNLLRPSDLMRVLVPWRSFGDLEKAQQFTGEYEEQLIKEVEERRDTLLTDLEDAYGAVLEPLSSLLEEQNNLDNLDLRVASVWASISESHPYLHPLYPLKSDITTFECKVSEASRSEKSPLKERVKALRAEYKKESKLLIEALKERQKQVNRAVKELTKLQEERNTYENEIRSSCDREISHIKQSAADLMRICSDPEESQKYFTVVETQEIRENEYNLNLPRYVDVFEPENIIPLEQAISDLEVAESDAKEAYANLRDILLKFEGSQI